MMVNTMGGPPPMPPGTEGTAAPGAGGASMPSIAQLAGMGGQQQGGYAPQTAGMSQISESVVRMGAEIDQALKLLAQSMPQLSPWVEQTCMQLRYQIGSALNSGVTPTNPAPQDNQGMPDGSGRL